MYFRNSFVGDLIMGEKYLCGRAVIDEQLNICSADEHFNTFLGNNAIYKLAMSVHPGDMNRLDEALETVNRGENTVIALRMVDSNGKYRWMLMSLESGEFLIDKPKTVNIEIQDISAYNETIQILEGKNNRYREYFGLFENLLFSYDVDSGKLRIFMMGSHQQINFYNGTLENWKESKLANDDIDIKSLNAFEQLYQDISTGAQSFTHELRMRMLETSVKKEWCVIKGKTIKDGYGRCHVIATASVVNPVTGNASDISLFEGEQDAGTDLLNKRAITEYVKRLIDAKPDNNITIAIIDIDNFKNINDRYGHMFGDEVIRAVADIIKSAVEGKGVAGRIGGDEMFIVIEGLKTNDDIRSVLRTIRNNVAWLYNNCDDKPNITCSIGSATYPNNADNYAELFNIADKMLYLAKEKGKNRYVIYHYDLHYGYINGEGMLKDEELAFYKYRKISVVNDVVNEYRKFGKEGLLRVYDKVMLAFVLDSIVVYEKQPQENLCNNSNDNDENSVNWQTHVVCGEFRSTDAGYLGKDNYIPSFTEDGIMVIDNINFFERVAKTAFKELSQAGVCQAIQFIVQDCNDSCIVSFNRHKQMSKWSEMDIMYLAILGNMIGMGYRDDK